MRNSELNEQLTRALHQASTGSIESVPQLLSLLELDLQSVEADLMISQKTLEAANREQPELFYKYNKISQRLRSIVHMIEQKIDQKKAVKYKQIKTSSNISLNTTDLNKWVDGDTEVQAMYTILILVQDVGYQYEAIVKAFEMRGYSLKNVTECRINMIDKMTII